MKCLFGRFYRLFHNTHTHTSDIQLLYDINLKQEEMKVREKESRMIRAHMYTFPQHGTSVVEMFCILNENHLSCQRHWFPYPVRMTITTIAVTFHENTLARWSIEKVWRHISEAEFFISPLSICNFYSSHFDFCVVLFALERDERETRVSTCLHNTHFQLLCILRSLALSDENEYFSQTA